jgi:hypothetical protein
VWDSAELTPLLSLHNADRRACQCLKSVTLDPRLHPGENPTVKNRRIRISKGAVEAGMTNHRFTKRTQFSRRKTMLIEELRQTRITVPDGARAYHAGAPRNGGSVKKIVLSEA